MIDFILVKAPMIMSVSGSFLSVCWNISSVGYGRFVPIFTPPPTTTRYGLVAPLYSYSDTYAVIYCGQNYYDMLENAERAGIFWIYICWVFQYSLSVHIKFIITLNRYIPTRIVNIPTNYYRYSQKNFYRQTSGIPGKA